MGSIFWASLGVIRSPQRGKLFFLKVFFMYNKITLGLTAMALGTTSAFSASIIPATLAADFTDGITDIGTIIGLIFGVVVTLYVFKAVKSTFSK